MTNIIVNSRYDNYSNDFNFCNDYIKKYVHKYIIYLVYNIFSI